MTSLAQATYGTCLVCHAPVPVINHAVSRGTHGMLLEEGYLGRHGRRGVRSQAKCRGSFGSWVEKRRGFVSGGAR